MSYHIPLIHLPKASFAASSKIDTYKTTCQRNTSDSNYPTDAWLKYSMANRVLTAIYDPDVEIIVKIKPDIDKDDHEIQIYDLLDHVNFGDMICHFTCRDNIMLYNREINFPR